MTLRSAILTFRIHRFETTLVVGATILSVLVSAAVVSWMSSSGYTSCLTEDGSQTLSSLCQGSLGLWVSRIARLSVTIVPLFPFLAGLLLGGPLVARELEGGTARLAWSLGPSRLRWFGQRAVPALALIVVAALVIGFVSEILLRTMHPTADLDQSFVGFRGRGLLVAVEALLIGSIAVALGAILGRLVPTLILTLILAAGIAIAVDKVENTLLTGEALVSDNFSWNGGDMYLTSRFRLADWTLATWEEMIAIHPEFQYQGPPENIANVTLYIPGSRYHGVELREAIGLTALAGAFLVIAGVAVMRRRPR